MSQDVRRRVFWVLHGAVERLDDGLHRLRRQVDRIEPPFVPMSLPEPHYENVTTERLACGHTLSVPVLSTATEVRRRYLLTSVTEHHAQECEGPVVPAS